MHDRHEDHHMLMAYYQQVGHHVMPSHVDVHVMGNEMVPMSHHRVYHHNLSCCEGASGGHHNSTTCGLLLGHRKHRRMAMWLGSQSQVAEWFQAPEWNARLSGHGGLIREDAARNLYTIDNNQLKRKKHESSLMVPFSPTTVTVADIARLPHISNNYCNREAADAEATHPLCRLKFKSLLILCNI